MFERFTEAARNVIVFAQEEAHQLKHNYIGTEHLLLGLLHEEYGVAAQTLVGHGLTLEGARAQIVHIVGRGQEVTSARSPFTPRAKRVLEMALREALALGCNYIGTEHLLLGLVREGEGVAARILDESAINFEQLRTELTEPLTMQESVSALNRAIKRTRADKEDAIRRQNFDEAIVCRAKERELKALKRELKE